MNAICEPYDSVIQPSSVEAVITYIGKELWKITHYYTIYDKCNNVEGVDHELYNITQDPMELNSLFDNPDHSETQDALLKLLNDYKVRYRTVEPD